MPSVRVQKEDTDADASGMETLGASGRQRHSMRTATPIDLDVRERLDLTYNGFTNWVLYARGELTEGQGNLKENGGIVPDQWHWRAADPAGDGRQPVLPEIQRRGPVVSCPPGHPGCRRVLQEQRVRLRPRNGQHAQTDSANRYPAYLVMQNFETYDGNVRLTLRPLRKRDHGQPLRVSVVHGAHAAGFDFGPFAKWNPRR